MEKNDGRLLGKMGEWRGRSVRKKERERKKGWIKILEREREKRTWRNGRDGKINGKGGQEREKK